MEMEIILPIHLTNGIIKPYNKEMYDNVMKMYDDSDVLLGFHKFYNKRSLKQNAYYWGFMMPHMVNFYKECYGEPISRDEIHAYNTKQILGEDFMVKEVFSVPIITKTSRKPSKLNTKDFGNFITEVQALWAEKGLYIPDSTDYYAKDASN